MDGITCIKCNQFKPLSEYHRQHGDFKRVCKNCCKAYRVSYLESNREKVRSHDRERRWIYKTSFPHFVNRMFTLMQMRVRGQGNNSQYYKDVPLCTRSEFCELALNKDYLKSLYKNWQNNNFKQRLIPTPDRIEASKGYVISNIQFLTLSDNISKKHVDKSKNKSCV